MMTRLFYALALLAAPALAQTPPPAAAAPAPLRVDITGGVRAPTPVAVPGFATAAAASTPAGNTAALGVQLAAVIAGDLTGSGLFRQVGPVAPVPYPQATAPDYATWTGAGAQALVTGFVTADGTGGLTVGCYLYDPLAKEELAKNGFAAPAAEWRRTAHKCADAVYLKLTGEPGYFDSRVIYIAETGSKAHRIKRLAVMDQDGANHRFLTNGQALALTPRFAPGQQTIAYMSYAGNRPRVYVYTLGTGAQRMVEVGNRMSFAPRFGPDGVLYLSVSNGHGNASIYRWRDGALSQLTRSASIDTSPSPSPDGKRIVFESDRGGSQQLYVMDAGGEGAHRISFGAGRYASPVWSPRGDLIAFTKIVGGKIRIGVMAPDGSGERLLTDSFQDEGATWAPNGRVLMFFRTERGSGHTSLNTVDLTGEVERRVPTPVDASDPAWSPLRP